jgi:protein-S-isoprenylcysteine O-methyltransferase Ste14
MMLFAEPTAHTMVSGGLMALFGELLRFWGVAYAGALTRVTGDVGAPQLVVTGPFAYVRNPLYVGNMLLYIGIGVMANALVPWLVLGAVAFFFIQYRIIVSLEEEFLSKTFPSAFEAYVKNVPRFVPRLTPFVSGGETDQRANWKSALRSERRTLQAIALVGMILIVLWMRA